MMICFLMLVMTIKADTLEMELDNVRGWPVISIDGTAVTQAGSGWGINVVVNDQPFPGPGTAEVVNDTPTERVIRYVRNHGTLEEQYRRTPESGQFGWMRKLRYTNTSDAVQDIINADFNVFPITRDLGERWNPDWFWMEETASGSVAVAYRGTTDMYYIESVTQGMRHRVNAAWRLQPGQTAEIAEQGIWWFDGNADDFREQAQVWYQTIGLSLPISYPQWVNESILYEVSAGGHIFSKFSDVGGFDNFQVQPPYLAEMGINTFWLNSVHQHKTAEGGWNFYGPLNFDVIDPAYGGAEGLHHLMEVIHDAGIQVIGGIVPHGHLSVQANALPGWWTVTREGELQRNWGGAGMDYSSPEWQQVMATATGRLATEFGMQGVRIDVAGGSGNNWGSPRTNHASYSTLAGSVELLEAIIDAMGEGVEHPVMLPECTRDFPEHYALGALGYGFPLVFAIADWEVKFRNNPAGWRNALQQFFERERGSLPEGALVVRSINNHDTVNDHGRPIQRFGVGLSRALYGVCLAVPGIPMMYQEEEIGSYDAFKSMIHARKHIPEFITGNEDYHSIDFAPEVFSVLRTENDTHALGLINLAGKTISGKVQLPEALALAEAVAWDGITGKHAVIQDHGFDWTLAPYQVTLLRLGAAPTAPPVAYPEPEGNEIPITLNAENGLFQIGDLEMMLCHDTTNGNWSHEVLPEGKLVFRNDNQVITVAPHENYYQVEIHAEAGSDPVELSIRNAAQWYVSGNSGLLSDRVLRRHYPWPEGSGYSWDRSVVWGPIPNWKIYNRVAPSGRIWESLFEPLHPEKPGLAFLDNLGQGVAVHDLTTNARRIVLTDRSDESEVEPYGLHLRFYQQDPDLSDAVSLFGMHQPWHLLGSVDIDDSASTDVSFFVMNTNRQDVHDLLDAERRPLDTEAAQVSFSHDATSEGQGYYWLREGGSVRWSNLAEVRKGPYRIRITMRHSERASEQYELRPTYRMYVNGNLMELEWDDQTVFSTGNAYFSYAYTPPVYLTPGNNVVEVATDKTWCAVGTTLYLIPGDPDEVPDYVRHSADLDRDGRINLGDLLRVVQFYNAGAYHCALPTDASPNGYLPGEGNRDCSPHDSDYAPQNWQINMRELLRLVQFYNAGWIAAVSETEVQTEDGFRPVF